ncbi:MAG TPA: hypothetical protein VHC90_14595 [Bryobacteraceae bacterium]|nr:hypothetical protein [Bryobacteraceae bacterium]
MRRAMYAFTAFVILGTATLPLVADEQADRDKLVGSWTEAGGEHAWVIESSANGLHMTQIEGTAPVADFTCATDGHDCDIRISGKKAKVSLYYNGSALVQLETKGDVITKRKFFIDGGGMKVEVTPMTGKSVATENREFERGQPTARK